MSCDVLPQNRNPLSASLLSLLIIKLALRKPQHYTGWLLLLIGIAILVYLLLESRQRSRKLEEVLQQTITPTIKHNQL